MAKLTKQPNEKVKKKPPTLEPHTREPTVELEEKPEVLEAPAETGAADVEDLLKPPAFVDAVYNACGIVVAGDSFGTGYVVGSDRTTVVTSGHVVQHLSTKEGRDAGPGPKDKSPKDANRPQKHLEDCKVLAQSPGLSVTFKSGKVDAEIVHLDPDSDVAVLKLKMAPAGVESLKFASPSEVIPRALCEIGLIDAEPSVYPESPGTDQLSAKADPSRRPTHGIGVIIKRDAQDRFGKERTTVRADTTRGTEDEKTVTGALSSHLLVRGHHYAGAPVLVGGRVVGHVVRAVRNPADITKPSAGIVEVARLDAILALLPEADAKPPVAPVDKGTRDPVNSGRLDPVNPGALEPIAEPTDSLAPPDLGEGEYHAFISYCAIERDRQNDQNWINGLQDRLVSRGFRCYAAPHKVFGAAASYRKPLSASRVALLVFSERWPELSSTTTEITEILDRVEEEKEKRDGFRAILVKLDQTKIPDRLSGLPVLDLANKRASFSKKLPSADAVLEVVKQLARSDAQTSFGITVDMVSADAGAQHDIRANEASGGVDSNDEPKQELVDAMLSEALEEVLGDLKAAEDTPELVYRIATRWIAAGMPGSDVPVEAARLLMEEEEFDLASELIEEAERRADADPMYDRTRDKTRVTRVKGMLLGKSGKHDQAIAVLEKLRKEVPIDQWTAGILASNYKQKWLRLGRKRRALLQRSYDIYLEAFSRTLDYYTGINAATLAHVLGFDENAAEIAKMIRSQLEQPGVSYIWEVATLAEAHLLLNDLDNALRYYSQAAVSVLNDPGTAVTIRQQFPLLFDYRNDDELPPLREKLDALFAIGGVAAFTGYRIDEPGENPARFPPGRERLANRLIREELDRFDISWGFCSASDGGDILFAEAVLDRGGRVDIYLPFALAAFRETCVSPSWRLRFDRLVSENAKRDGRGRKAGRVKITVLGHDQPDDRARESAGDDADLATALLRCSIRVLDEAIEHGTARGERPILIGMVDRDDDSSLSAFTTDTAEDEGLVVRLLPFNAEPRLTAKASAVEEEEEDVPAGKSRAKLSGGGAPIVRPSNRPPLSGLYKNRYLVAIGVNRYDNWPRLVNAESDAETMVEVLEEEYGFTVVEHLVGAQATKTSIERAISDKLASEVEEDDLVVIFYAGHGETEQKPNGQQAGYLVPVDAPVELKRTDLIAMSAFNEWTEHLKCRHLLVVFDSCFSGVASTGGSSDQGKAGNARKVITAGNADQEVADGGDGNSIFTSRLRKALSDTENEGLPTPLYARDIAAYLVRHVQSDAIKMKRTQKPTDGQLPGDGGDTIVFTKKGADAEE